jgi:hypothetical protein
MAKLVDSSDEQRAAFAQALEVYLRRAKMRPMDLVRALNEAGLLVHQPSMSHWMRGDYEPPRLVVVEMERLLDLTPGLLARTLGWLPLAAVAMTVSDVETAILADELLTPEQRDVLLVAYRSLIAL